MLTPESILFPCQIKELTNNHELITTANKLGHCVSYTKLQELLSEVTYAKIEAAKEKIALPEFCNQETFTMLVEDNIDCLEETLSGKCLILNLTYFSQVLHCYLRFPESIRGY